MAAWCLYDWANSAFTTLVVTFIYSTYFTKAIAPDEITGTAWWSRSVALTALVVAILSPLLGAMADAAGLRRRLLTFSTMLCVITTAALAFVPPGASRAVLVALVLVTVANIAFELGIVFYNSYLPDITTPGRIGRVSGYGWGLGYAGGLLCLVVALVGFVQPEAPWFGLSREAGWNVRATNLLVAAWMALFSLPLLMLAPSEQPSGMAPPNVLRSAVRELKATFRQIRRYRETGKLLLARLFYGDGLNTVFAFGGIYAAGTFGMSFTEILIFGIGLNVAAGAGALAFGFVDDRIGGKKTVLISVAALTLATAMAVWAPDRTWLWAAGLMIGLFSGPNQSASRSLMGRFVPDGRESEFFGFFAFSGKLASFLGPLLLGAVTQSLHSQRAGVATVIGFFVVGGALLVLVDEPRGIAAARGDASVDGPRGTG